MEQFNQNKLSQTKTQIKNEVNNRCEKTMQTEKIMQTKSYKCAQKTHKLPVMCVL